MRSVSILEFSVLIVWLSYIQGQKIVTVPNGDQILDPCDGTVWKGIRDDNRNIGTEPNQFTKDFEEAGEDWTEELCRSDSDGDGKTNGEELGDPNCVWRVGTDPERTTEITNPALCDPEGSPMCSHQTIDCDDWCPIIKDPEVISMKVMLPKQKVPPQEATYQCVYRKLLADKMYDIIASRAIIDNANTSHHLNMYGCDGDLADELDGSTDDCTMGLKSCSKQSIHVWSPFIAPFCHSRDAAIRVGKDKIKWVQVLIHRHNPLLIDTFTDGSGIEIWLTPKLRKYEQDILRIVEDGIFIPPNAKNFTVTGFCSSDCSRRSWEKPFYVTSLLHHAHHNARRLVSHQYRDGKLLRVLWDDDHFVSRQPVKHFYDNPIEIRPGDELKLECIYDTTGYDRWTIIGKEEMCEILFDYYPAHQFKVDDCYSVAHRCRKGEDDFAPGCSLDEMVSRIRPHTDHLLEHCDVIEGIECSEQCAAILDEIKSNFDQCFVDQPSDVYRSLLLTSAPYRLSKNSTVTDQLANALRCCELLIPPVEN